MFLKPYTCYITCSEAFILSKDNLIAFINLWKGGCINAIEMKPCCACERDVEALAAGSASRVSVRFAFRVAFLPPRGSS